MPTLRQIQVVSHRNSYSKSARRCGISTLFSQDSTVGEQVSISEIRDSTIRRGPRRGLSEICLLVGLHLSQKAADFAVPPEDPGNRSLHRPVTFRAEAVSKDHANHGKDATEKGRTGPWKEKHIRTVPGSTPATTTLQSRDFPKGDY